MTHLCFLLFAVTNEIQNVHNTIVTAMSIVSWALFDIYAPTWGVLKRDLRISSIYVLLLGLHFMLSLPRAMINFALFEREDYFL